MLREPITMQPSEEAEIRELHRMLQLGTPALVGPADERIELPHSVFHLLKDVVSQMMRGRTIVLTPQNNRLTTQAAANFLGFSRPHLIKLLDAGTIPFEKVGQHRRILFEDLNWLITPKEHVGIVGGNGTGKSTLLKVLSGVEHLDYGSVNSAKGIRAGYLPQDGINLTVDVEPDLTVAMNAGQLQQVLMNLIVNARSAMVTKGRAGGRRLTIRAGRSTPRNHGSSSCGRPTTRLVTTSLVA